LLHNLLDDLIPYLIMKKLYITPIVVFAITQFSYAQFTFGGGISTTSDAVGIGTANPQGKLHIAGAFNNQGVGIQDGYDRPGLSITGNYPQLVLMAGGAGNVNHGSSISLGAFDSGSAGSFKSWTLGTPGYNATFMDIGYGTSTNPHVNGVGGLGTTVMRLTNSGNVGIGTTSPNAKLDVNGVVRLGGGDYGGATVMSVAPGTIGFDAPGISGGRFYISGTNGYVGIGTNTPDAKLAVKGTIHTQEVKVDLNVPGPDYVFNADYKPITLSEIKDYVVKNHHLPEIPSAAEIEKNGLNLGEMNIKLLKKVEELTLYLIEKDKQIENQNKQLLNQQKISESLQAQISDISKKLNHK
jgi:hypothetical protein